MKYVLILILSLFWASTAMPLTQAERAIVLHVKEVVKRQAKELEDVRAKLVWTDTELKNKQPEIDRLGLERDQWKGLYEKDHEAKIKAEKRILQLYLVLGALVVLIGVYAYLKFGLHLPI